MAGVLAAAVPGPAPAKRMRTKASPAYVALLGDIGGENADANQRVYLGTISRVLPGSAAASGHRDLGTVGKDELITMIRDSIDNPISTAGSAGRPRKRTGSPIDSVVVVREKHADGSPHFHFVVKLFWNMKFKSFGLATLTTSSFGMLA